MKKSCGVLIKHNNKYLLGHATGQDQKSYGIPKGAQEKGETDKMTALRELYEETNISLPEESLSDEPIIQYKTKSGKTIVVFSAELAALPDKIFCHSIVEGRNYPEFDDFKWVTKEEALASLNNHMKKIFEELRE